jgi:hypothetical protein
LFHHNCHILEARHAAVMRKILFVCAAQMTRCEHQFAATREENHLHAPVPPCSFPRSLAAPIAQLDRASDYGSEGYRFNSYWVRHGFMDTALLPRSDSLQRVADLRMASKSSMFSRYTFQSQLCARLD